MTKKTKNTILMIIGIFCIIMSIVCFANATGGYSRNQQYGGDAYTGIQNAAAQTANNVTVLIHVAKIGFGSILLVTGLCLILYSIPTKQDEKSIITDNPQQPRFDDLPEI